MTDKGGGFLVWCVPWRFGGVFSLQKPKGTLWIKWGLERQQ
jgi:hypothetical protein